ncbi:hypothetical protein AMJ85_10830, partial [candidate division BRC1 bacterium SM23_51]
IADRYQRVAHQEVRGGQREARRGKWEARSGQEEGKVRDGDRGAFSHFFACKPDFAPVRILMVRRGRRKRGVCL